MTELPGKSAHLSVNGVRLHFRRQGSGPALILLHGWPEFSRIWRHNIAPLAERFDVVAPDLRGFGDSDKPEGGAANYALDLMAEDIRALADALSFGRFGLVAHDVGAYVAQEVARRWPERLTGLFFFDCPYPGIGRRWIEPAQIKEIWYQTFNQQPWAAALVGSSRQACAIYFRHFLDHWADQPGRFAAEDLEAWVDNFLKPGNLQGGFNWYVNAAPARLKMIQDGAPALAKISVPTRVRWGTGDKVLKVAWADRLGDYFADVDFAPFPGAGHFAMYERPDQANRLIAEFFAGRS